MAKQSQNVVSKTTPATSTPAVKLHWTKTPAGKKRLAEIQRRIQAAKAGNPVTPAVKQPIKASKPAVKPLMATPNAVSTMLTAMRDNGASEVVVGIVIGYLATL